MVGLLFFDLTTFVEGCVGQVTDTGGCAGPWKVRKLDGHVNVCGMAGGAEDAVSCGADSPFVIVDKTRKRSPRRMAALPAVVGYPGEQVSGCGVERRRR